ncbi:TRAP transporter large permease [Bordetella sp. 15P40C-2]|uniref:TRAP transporter large permease n=1 Tax=Bordetella sp. 15P40C-2 TaxID=2572246 RepID=UPI001323E7D5|nr:TRAP transporter large permease subunit [Bordetella sp. 15P40C-2]MVW72363.1 TRAP transporter large permease subunit [Bordetella sp. 15P40C-2]
MSEVQIGLGAICSLMVLLAMRAPIGASLIAVSFAGIWAIVGWRSAYGAIGNIPYDFAASWSMSSIPMFLLMGYLAYHCRLTSGLFEAARVWTSRIPGGLAVGAVFGSSAFAAVCGSSVACSAAMGKIAVPEMTRVGYSPMLSTGTVAVAGTIGALIPPSILLIIYGVMAEVSVIKLFMGGLVIGMLSAITYVVVILIRVWLNPALAPRDATVYSLRDKLAVLRKTWPMLVISASVFGGMFSGLFTPTEAGAVGAFLTFLVALLTRELTWRIFRTTVMETLLTTSALMIIGVGASLFARLLVISGLDVTLGDAITSLYSSSFMLIVTLVVIYLLLGMFLEPIGAMMLTLPIVLPIVKTEGISLIWFGIFLAKLLEVGMVTPPIGMNVFVIKRVVGNLISLGGIFRGVLWFVVADLILIFLIYFFPALVTWLPDTLS